MIKAVSVVTDGLQSRRTGQVDVEVGLRIRQARTGADMSQEELASSIGVSCQQLQKYETASNRISASRLIAIADALRIDVATLLRDAPLPVTVPPVEHEQLLRLMRSFLALRTDESRRKIVELAEFLERIEHA